METGWRSTNNAWHKRPAPTRLVPRPSRAPESSGSWRWLRRGRRRVGLAGRPFPAARSVTRPEPTWVDEQGCGRRPRSSGWPSPGRSPGSPPPKASPHTASGSASAHCSGSPSTDPSTQATPRSSRSFRPASELLDALHERAAHHQFPGMRAHWQRRQHLGHRGRTPLSDRSTDEAEPPGRSPLPPSPRGTFSHSGRPHPGPRRTPINRGSRRRSTARLGLLSSGIHSVRA
jgi:hypothetical protein